MTMSGSYKVPSREELEQGRKGKGRKGVLKHFILRHDLDRLVTEYSKKLGVSQAQVIEEMIVGGVNRFEVNHGFRVGEKRNEKREESLTEQLNEKIQLQIEQKKRDSAKKSSDLANAYGKKIVHDYNNDDWQTQGYA